MNMGIISRAAIAIDVLMLFVTGYGCVTRHLDRLNYVWGTSFWSQYYYDWDDILPPRITPASNNPSSVTRLFQVHVGFFTYLLPLPKQIYYAKSHLMYQSQPILSSHLKLPITFPGLAM